MRHLAWPLVLFVVILAAPWSRAPAEEPAPAAGGFTEEEQNTLDKALKFERELVRLVEKVRPSSVTIENWREKGGRLGLAGGGSGVIVSSKGHVLTNQHVVQGAQEVWVVLLDHRRLKAEIVGADKRGDIALLKIPNKRIRHTNPRKANPGRLSAGEVVIATGNPFFLGRDGAAVVTLGVISGLGRIAPGQFFYGDAIQHDARINPGNSGGPLWDTNGNLLGINGKIAFTNAGGLDPSSSGVSFSIPIDQIRNFFEPMMEGRTAKHGDELLGIKVVTHLDESGKQAGAKVTEVRRGSPAQTARAGGIRVGDVVWKITVRGRPRKTRNVTDYLNTMSPLAEGAKVSIHVLRGYKRIVYPSLILEERGKRR